MTEIIFSFDTEDFTNPASADAILREAKVFESEGVRGCFCMVGLLAQNLKKWGRTDITEALKYHEIGLHTYGHSLHPTVNEYTDIFDFDTAVNEVIRQETRALEMIRDTFGDRPIYAVVPPGNQKSYAAMYAYSKLGIPIYADTFCDNEEGSGAYWCNIFQTAYTYSMETEIFCKDPQEKIKKMLDVLAKRKRAIIYTHPHNSMFSQAWDILNFFKGNLHTENDYAIPTQKTAEVTEMILENMRLLINTVKNDSRFKITTYEELAKKIAKENERTITPNDIPWIRKKLKENFYPINGDISLSLADITLACADFLRGEKEHKCGNVIGPMELFGGTDREITVDAEDIKRTAYLFSADRPLCDKIAVSDEVIGLADWLYAALDVLCSEQTVKISPKPQNIDLSEFPRVRDCAFRGQWIQCDSFRDLYLSDRLRFQAWTMRKINI